MSDTRKLDLAWLALVGLSVIGAGLGGQHSSGLGMSALVALVMGIKVRIVCDHFLELPTAHRRIRQAMYTFCYGMPLLVILTTAFASQFAWLTAIFVN